MKWVLTLLLLAFHCSANQCMPQEVKVKDVPLNPNSIQRDYLAIDSANQRSERGLAIGDLSRRIRRSGGRQSLASSSPLPPPFSISLEAVNSSCLRLTWRPPTLNVTRYEYSCNTSAHPLTNISSLSQEVPVCGLSPYTWVVCNVSAHCTGCGEQNATATARTNCAAPSRPWLWIPFSGFVRAHHSGRARWKKEYILRSPGQINCESIVSYQLSYQGMEQRFSRPGSTTIYLDGNVWVTVELTVTNNENFRSDSSIDILHTPILEPQVAPTDVKISVINATCVNLSWSPPMYENGGVDNYEYRCNKSSWSSVSRSIRSAAKCQLPSFEEISCEVVANNSAGKSQIANRTLPILCARLAELAVSVTDSVQTDSSGGRELVKANITWNVPPVPDGCISGYKILLNSSSRLYTQSSGSSGLVVGNLEPYTPLNISVTLVYADGEVIENNSLLVTRETKPFDGPSLELSFTTSCVYLTISSPAQPNGQITHYKYECHYSTAAEATPKLMVNSSEVGAQNKSRFCDLVSASKLVCTVIAVNGAGESPAVQQSGYTLLKVVSSMSYVTVSVHESVELKLTPFKFENVKVTASFYQVLVSFAERSSTVNGSAFGEATVCNTSQLYSHSEATRQGLPCYIAAVIRASEVSEIGYTLTLGDRKDRGGYVNVPLDAGKEYYITVGVIVEMEDNVALVHYLPPSLFTAPGSGCNQGCIIGVVIGVVTLCLGVAATGAVFIYRKWRNSERGQENQAVAVGKVVNQSAETTNGNKYKRTQYEQVELALAKHQTEFEYEEIDQKDIYANISLTHGAILLSDISSHCDNANIMRQFQGLEMKIKKLHPQYTAEVSDVDPIYAVACSAKGFDTAIFVDAFQRPNHFIVVSRPTEEFWDMMFDREVKVIVQLDNKSSEFYPTEDGDSYYMSKFVLTRVETEKNDLMSIVRLSVEEDDLYVLVVNCWADDIKGRGYPRLSSMNAYFDTLEEYETTGEVCIVDSDGFSKSGLFLTAYNVVSQAKIEQKVDIHQTVYTARSRRPQFVSDVKSYRYLHRLAQFYAKLSDDA